MSAFEAVMFSGADDPMPPPALLRASMQTRHEADRVVVSVTVDVCMKPVEDWARRAAADGRIVALKSLPGPGGGG